jgi:hypothetical protein
MSTKLTDCMSSEQSFQRGSAVLRTLNNFSDKFAFNLLLFEDEVAVRQEVTYENSYSLIANTLRMRYNLVLGFL